MKDTITNINKLIKVDITASTPTIEEYSHFLTGELNHCRFILDGTQYMTCVSDRGGYIIDTSYTDGNNEIIEQTVNHKNFEFEVAIPEDVDFFIYGKD